MSQAGDGVGGGVAWKILKRYGRVAMEPHGLTYM